MSFLILSLIILIGLWIFAGYVLLVFKNRPVGNAKECVRFVDQSVVKIGDTVKVTLQSTPNFVFDDLEDQDIVFVLDRSGSMGAASVDGDPLHAALHSAKALVRKFPSNIHVGLIVFDELSSIACPVTGHHSRVVGALDNVESGGATNIPSALELISVALSEGRSGVKKAFFLLTDGQDDTALCQSARQAIEAKFPNVLSLCAGFGPGINQETLQAIAGESQNVFLSNDTDDIATIFDTFGARVGGKTGSLKIVEHRSRQDAFLLDVVNDGWADKNKRTINWASPVMEAVDVSVSYELEAHCAGWWPVASSADVAWKIADGSEHTQSLGQGPKVLILPVWAYWLRLLFNPLSHFWLSKLPCEDIQSTRQSSDLKPLIPAPRPERLPLLGVMPPALNVRPTIVIGLGKSGEEILKSLQGSFQDRKVEGELIWTGVILSGNNLSKDLECDWFMPLEAPVASKAFSEGLAERSWLSQRNWAKPNRALHSFRGVQDNRALARWIFLNKLSEIKKGFDDAANAVKGKASPPQVVIVGATDDAILSGVVFDVCYLFSQHKIPTKVILSASNKMENGRGAIRAFADELDTVLSLRGEKFSIDPKHDGDIPTRLIDEVIICGSRYNDYEVSQKETIEAAWSLICYPNFQNEVSRRIKNTGTCAISSEVLRIPQFGLAQAALSRLKLEFYARLVGLGDVAEPLIRQSCERFWSAAGLEDNLPPLLPLIASSIGGGVTAMSGFISSSEDVAASPREWIKDQPQVMSNYLDAWILAETGGTENGQDLFSFRALLGSLSLLRGDIERSAEHFVSSHGGARDYEGNGVILSVLDAFDGKLAATMESIKSWIVELSGDESLTSLSFENLELMNAAARKEFVETSNMYSSAEQADIEKSYGEWSQKHIGDLFGRVYLSIESEKSIIVDGLGQRAEDLESLNAGFLDWMSQYETEPLGWVSQFNPIEVVAGNPDGIYIGDDNNLDLRGTISPIDKDSFYAAAFSLRLASIHDTLECNTSDDLPNEYVLNEEVFRANVTRAIRREIQPNAILPPQSVLPLRDPEHALSVLRHLAANKYSVRAGDLCHNGAMICSALLLAEQSGNQAHARFAQLLVNGTLETLSDKSQKLSGDDLIAAVIKHPFLSEFVHLPDWPEWESFILGLSLFEE